YHAPAWHPEFAELVTSTEYDALNRPTTKTLPARDLDSPPDPNVITYGYDTGGHLTSVHVQSARMANPVAFVNSIDYNENHQRAAIEYGTDSATYGATITNYTYDPLTFRLATMVTERAKKAGGSDTLQNLTYIYDAIGNIVEITDVEQDEVY